MELSKTFRTARLTSASSADPLAGLHGLWRLASAVSSVERMGDAFHDKESEQFVARYMEHAPLSLEKISIQDDIVTDTTKDGTAHEFDALEFLVQLSCHIPKTYESLTKYYGQYSCRRRGERAKISPPQAEEQESDCRRDFRRSSWAACIKRAYEVDSLKCPPSA